MNNKVLVSACLVGLPVRYDGRAKPVDATILERWREEGRMVHFCPEVAAGFPTPRPPAEIRGGGGAKVLLGEAVVVDRAEADVSAMFVDGARQALALAQANGIRVALLTDGSPSCGSGFIYSGDFSGRTLDDVGVTTALLTQHGIRVFGHSRIEDADAWLRALDAQTDEAAT